jgi:hypothetical protein
MAIRKIAYLTNVPIATVGDICKRDHDSLPEPIAVLHADRLLMPSHC